MRPLLMADGNTAARRLALLRTTELLSLTVGSRRSGAVRPEAGHRRGRANAERFLVVLQTFGMRAGGRRRAAGLLSWWGSPAPHTPPPTHRPAHAVPRRPAPPA